PELTSVRVPGQLQVDAVPDGLVNRLGLVGHEDQRAAWVTALDGSREVRPMSNVEVRRLVVVDARQVKDLPGALDGDVLVAEDSEAELAQVLAPRWRARVVLMVSGHEERAVGRPEPGQRRDVSLEVFDATVHQIARDEHSIGREGVHARDDVFEERTPERLTDVQVRELDEAQSVELAG